MLNTFLKWAQLKALIHTFSGGGGGGGGGGSVTSICMDCVQVFFVVTHFLPSCSVRVVKAGREV